MRFKATCVGLLMLCGALPVHAMTVGEYTEMAQHHPAVAGSYLAGAGKGIEWTNSSIEKLHGKGMFCLPDKLELNVENYTTMLGEGLKREPDADSPPNFDISLASVPLVLLKGFVMTFPCD